MSIFTIDGSITRIQKTIVKNNMPWLWAVKPYWSFEDHLEIVTAKDDHLNWWIPQHKSDPSKSVAYVHLLDVAFEEVLRIEINAPQATWFDVMIELHKQYPHYDATHFAGVVGNCVRVDKPPKGTTFRQMFVERVRNSIRI